MFGDPVVATAILDRPLHHSHVITIRDDSYRLKEKRRSRYGAMKGALRERLASVPQNNKGVTSSCRRGGKSGRCLTPHYSKLLTSPQRSLHRCDDESDLASIAQASFTAWISALLVVRSSSVRWRKRGAS